MIIDLDGFEFDLDNLFDAYTRLFKDMGIDATDDQQVYDTITVFLASLLATGLQETYGDDPAGLETELRKTSHVIVEDLEEKIRMFLNNR